MLQGISSRGLVAAALVIVFANSAFAVAPVIDLDTSKSGLSRKVSTVGTGNQETYVFSLFSSLITDADSTELTELEVRLLNAPDGAQESLYISFPPAGITVTPYNPATGVLKLSGTDTLTNYRTALNGVVYRNQNLAATGGVRYLSVRGNDGTEWSEESPGRLLIVTRPSEAEQTILFNDDFNGGSFDLGNWSVFRGTTPTVSGGRVTLADSDIRPLGAWSGAPLYIEFTNVDFIDFTNTSGVGFVVRGVTGTPSRSTSFSRGTSTGFGDFYSTSSGYGATALESLTAAFSFPPAREIVDDDGTVGFMLTGETSYYWEVYWGGGTGFAIVGQHGTYRPEILCSLGASMSMDRVRISEVTPLNPANPTWRAFPTGATPTSRTFGSTGVTIALSHSNATIAQAASVTRLDVAPRNVSGQPAPFFWELTGPASGTYNASIDFTFSATTLTNAGIDPNEVSLYKSSDDGLTWQQVAGANVNGPAGTASVTGVTSFSLWTLAAPAPPSSATSWMNYE